ncbi:exo-alpha-sialidase [Pseudactinotalea sp. Z1748]|uniref:exo-alpha-sialidase n=1 Tax=Pseudactinotalea sp. Z1748 TaxID=3413027 RepID=UPI003C7DD659
MRYLNRPARAVSLLAAALSVTLAAPAAAVSADPDEHDVVVAERTDDRNVFFPTVERTQDGELLVVYYDSPGHADADGRISMVRSTDDGETWSSPEVLIDSELDDRDPSLIETSDGTLLMNFFRTDWHSDPAEIVGTFVTKSEDGGDTWSEPVLVETEMSGESDILDGPYQTGWAGTSDKILELDNGELLVPIYGTVPDDPDRRASVVRSTDGGETWPIENESSVPHDPGWSLNEPALTQARDGEVTMMIRTHHGDGAAYVTTSDDRGLTWSHPVATNLHAAASDLLTLRNGMVFHTWGDTSGDFGAGRPVVGAVQRPNQDWTEVSQRLLYDGSPGDQSYPSSVEISPNQFFTVSYDAPRGMIVGTFSHLSDYMRAEPDPPGQQRDMLDLLGMYESDALDVETDMTWMNPSYPGMGPLSPLDGSSDYWNAATIDRDAPPASYYTIEFDEPQQLDEVGVVLKPGYPESANVHISSDGEEWDEPIARFEGEVTNELVWIPVPHGPVKALRVEVTDSFGEWAQLTRMEMTGR